MKTITLLQINDTHGYLEQHAELIWTKDGPSLSQMGGFARIAHVFKGVRAKADGDILAFDNGDTFHGTPALVRSRGQAAIPILNALGLSAMTGHWDFAFGPARMAELAAQLNYPFLAANCRTETDDAPRFPASMIYNGSTTIGVIGLAATILDKTMPPSFSEGLSFTDGLDETKAEAAQLRSAGCELIVVLSHLGFPQDCALADAVDGIDVILSGHTHNRLTKPAVRNGALIIQSGCHGSFVGRLDLWLEAGVVVRHRHELIAIEDDVEEDPEVAPLVADAVADVAELKKAIVGTTDTMLHRATCLDAPMDDVLLAAIARSAETRIAFSNGWRYGAPIPAGPVSEYDLWCMIPTNSEIQTVELSGAEIMELIEENLEATFGADPFRQRGGYAKRFRGLEFNVKLENPTGHRIEAAFTSDGDQVRQNEVYRVAFVSTQGVPERFGRNRSATSVRAVDALRDWFADSSNEVGFSAGRFRVT